MIPAYVLAVYGRHVLECKSYARHLLWHTCSTSLIFIQYKNNQYVFILPQHSRVCKAYIIIQYKTYGRHICYIVRVSIHCYLLNKRNVIIVIDGGDEGWWRARVGPGKLCHNEIILKSAETHHKLIIKSPEINVESI